jgi:hypothetical protein
LVLSKTDLHLHSDNNNKTTNPMKTQEIANYIEKLCKSVNKDLAYALSIVCWYTMTGKQDEEVSNLIIKNW